MAAIVCKPLFTFVHYFGLFFSNNRMCHVSHPTFETYSINIVVVYTSSNYVMDLKCTYQRPNVCFEVIIRFMNTLAVETFNFHDKRVIFEMIIITTMMIIIDIS